MESEQCTSKNINEKDRLLLVELVEKQKNIIECKRTDSISNKKKFETWEVVRTEYNSRRVGAEKNSQQLKVAYKNLKGKVRKDVAAERLERFKTGGGLCSKTVKEDPILSIVGNSITPNHNPYDSSADLFGDTEEFVNYEFLSSEEELNGSSESSAQKELMATQPTAVPDKCTSTRKRPMPRKKNRVRR